MILDNLLSAKDVFETIGLVLLAILGIMVMITVHEFGHYVVGKIFKFKINEFAIGMGPAIFKKQKKDGEIFSIRMLPLGGYCAFEGEDEENPSPEAFNNKEPWKRILVLIAGATMNYLLALLIIIVSMNVYGQSVVGVQIAESDRGQSEMYVTDALKSGDFILSVKNKNKKTQVYMATDLISALNHAKKGETVEVEVMRTNEEGNPIKTVSVKLLNDVECKNITETDKVFSALGFGYCMHVTNDGRVFSAGDYILKIHDYSLGTDDEAYNACDFVFGAAELTERLSEKEVGETVGFWVWSGQERVLKTVTLGEDWAAVDKTDEKAVLKYFGIEDYGVSHYTVSAYKKVDFFMSLTRSVGYSVRIGGTIFRTLGELLTGRLGIKSVGGTVTTIITTTKVMRMGLRYALEIFAFIGVNLAVFNLLPIPALDGSKVVFCVIEWIRKKPLNRKVEAIIHAVGFVLILGFAILVDVLQFV